LGFVTNSVGGIQIAILSITITLTELLVIPAGWRDFETRKRDAMSLVEIIRQALASALVDEDGNRQRRTTPQNPDEHPDLSDGL
jgi:hypothetical protein